MTHTQNTHKMKNTLKFTNRIAKLEIKMDAFIKSHKQEDGSFDWDTIFASKEYRAIGKEQDTAKNEKRYWEAKEIQEFANFAGYSDWAPYEVVKVISDITVEIRPMETKQIKFPKDFHPGGFCGHFADNASGQEYEYTSNPEFSVIRIRWSEADKVWKNSGMRYHMAAAPYKHHDYNF